MCYSYKKMNSIIFNRLGIFLVLVILGLCISLYKSTEHYDSNYSMTDHMNLYKSCNDAGLIPNLPFGSAEDQIAAAENKCKLGCYPSDRVCKKECRDRTSPQCLACVTKWSNEVTSDGEFPMPCDVRDIAPTQPTKKMIKEIAGLETIATSCDEICGFGQPKSLGSKNCLQCLDKFGVDLSEETL